MLLAALLTCRAFTAALSPARAPLLLSSPRVAAAAVAGGRTLAPRLTGAAVARGEDVAGSRPQIVAEEDVLAYVDSVLAADAAINHPLIPDKVERRMYGLVVRVVLRSLSIGLGALDESVLLGRVLRVRLEPSEQSRCRWPLLSTPLSSHKHTTPGPRSHMHRQSRRERQRRQPEGSTGSQEGECEAGSPTSEKSSHMTRLPHSTPARQGRGLARTGTHTGSPPEPPKRLR